MWEVTKKISINKLNCREKADLQGKQIFLEPDQLNFKEKFVSPHLAADIPLHKLNHPDLKYLFATMGKLLLSQIEAGASDAQSALQKQNQI